MLTFYTQKNKSSTIFLGTQGRSVKEELCEGNVSGNGESSKSESLHITVALGWFMCFMLSFKGSKWELFGGLTNPLLQKVSEKD